MSWVVAGSPVSRRLWRRTLPGLAFVLVALAGCGLARGSYWAGQSTSGAGACVPFEFEVNREGDRVVGWAATQFEWGAVAWDVVGMVAPDNTVTIDTVTQDPRVARRRIRWSGQGNVFGGTLQENGKDEACPAPRTVTLRRK